MLEKFILTTLGRGGGFVDTRVVWGFLSLEKTYPREAVEEAAGIALELNTFSSRLVERLIKLTLTQAKKDTAKPQRGSGTAKFARPMSVYSEHLKDGLKSTTTSN